MVIYMKETGVIRRIDELGRIVIPKEIRKRLRVGPGDMLDIYTSDKQIVLSKYTELNEIDEHLLYLLKAFKNNHLDLIVTSSSDVIASTTNRISKHDVITEEFLNLFLKDGSISLTPSNQISLTKQVKFEKYIFGRKLLKLGDLKACPFRTGCPSWAEAKICLRCRKTRLRCSSPCPGCSRPDT